MPPADAAHESARGDRASAPAWRSSAGLAAAFLVLATWLAYANSFWAPFIFDDQQTVTYNASIRQLWPLGPVLSPPPGGGTTGRPVANLSLALNYAAGGHAVFGYHAVNLAIHALAALTLCGVVRRTLAGPACRNRYGGWATPLGTLAALLWAVHPLQTEAVTYTSQRTETLMTLFYLQALYGFVRATESASPQRWLVWSVAACWLGAMTKEVAVTAPVLVLLYDRTFVAGSFREAWRRRWGYYLGLAGTWVLLALLMRGMAARHVGYGLGVSFGSTVLTESWAVVNYLRLAVWPHPLLFDYGAGMMPVSVVTLGCLIVVAVLTGLVAWACWRRPPLGFAGAAVLLALAPASSVVPVVMQPVAEHRMYLALAGVVVWAVLALYEWVGTRVVVVGLLVAAGFGILTSQRNTVYFSEVSLWGDVVRQRPDSARARNNYGSALVRVGQLDEAARQFAWAVKLSPDDSELRYNFANSLLQMGRFREAEEQGAAALRLKPNSVEAHSLMGSALAQTGRMAEAAVHFEQAVQFDPASFGARFNLGQARLELGRHEDAVKEFAEAVRLQPDFAEAHQRLGNALAKLQRLDEAKTQWTEAQRLGRRAEVPPEGR